MLVLSQMVERQIGGCPMEECPRVSDLPWILDAKQTHIGVLNQVRRRMPTADDPPQTRQQLLLVRVKQAFEIQSGRLIHRETLTISLTVKF